MRAWVEGGPVGPQAWRDCNVNDLTDLQRYDTISGFPVYKALLCEVIKLDETVPKVTGGRSEKLKSRMPVKDVSRMAGTKRRIYLDAQCDHAAGPGSRGKLWPNAQSDASVTPSSIHAPGNEARFIVESARRQVRAIAQLHGTKNRVHAGGGSESGQPGDQRGSRSHAAGMGNHIITTSIEHPAVLGTCNWLEPARLSRNEASGEPGRAGRSR